jgi:hypothetical protein
MSLLAGALGWFPHGFVGDFACRLIEGVWRLVLGVGLFEGLFSFYHG